MPAQTPRPEHSPAATLLAVLLTAAACGRAAPTGAVPSSADCAVVDDIARPRIVFGVADAGGRLSAGGASDAGLYSAARFAGAQLHETLVRADCTGDVVAGLADEWSTADGRIWRFRVTRGATFADGTPVDAQSVASAWSAARTGLVAGITAASQYDLRVALHAPADVRVFAMPVLAVVRRTADGWPAGTGPYAPDAASPNGILRLIAREDAAETPIIPAADARAPDTIDVRTFGRDLRTAIDAGVDALVTGDAATIAYARARPDYSIASLPWVRTHVLATSPRAPSHVGDSAAVLTDGAAWFPQEVVRVAARTALPPFWWQDCAPRGPAPARAATDGRV
ncbi:MAG: ABC transporter substrate-binding protein, partial [Longimicrobiales bacterium]